MGPAMSSAGGMRFRGIGLPDALLEGRVAEDPGAHVRVDPAGATQLTRMPLRPSSAARDLVKACIAPLEAA